ncbi:MAG: type II secretion system protein GspG [Pseudomonadota bacterium]
MQKFLYGFISAILILLTLSIIYPWWSDTKGCTKCYQVIAEMNEQSLAIELHYRKFGKLPSNEEGLEILVGEFLEELNNDPWGGKYFYSTLNFDNRQCYVIWSFGSDLKPGGEKESEKDFSIFGKNENCL